MGGSRAAGGRWNDSQAVVLGTTIRQVPDGRSTGTIGPIPSPPHVGEEGRRAGYAEEEAGERSGRLSALAVGSYPVPDHPVRRQGPRQRRGPDRPVPSVDFTGVARTESPWGVLPLARQLVRATSSAVPCPVLEIGSWWSLPGSRGRQHPREIHPWISWMTRFHQFDPEGYR